MPVKWRHIDLLSSMRWPVSRLVNSVLELGLLLAWSLYLGREYLTHLGAQYVPSGREFGALIASHHFWSRVLDCGLCALWNGDQGGGYPALAEAVGAPFHPLVALATLALGVVDGAKLTVILALFVGALAGWWLAVSLGLSRVARLWAGLLGAGGGYIAAKMELGAVTLAFSTATCALLLPAAFHLWYRKTSGAVVLFGIVVASAILSGQGYVQIAALMTFPSYLILALSGRGSHLRFFAAGMLVALALTAFYLLPTLNFASVLTKWSDPQFAASQPLEYVLLNLVIRDVKFYTSEVLGKLPYPHMYANYLGWPAVILAMLTVTFARREDRIPLAFLLCNFVLGLLIISGVLPRLLVKLLPDLAMARFITAGNGILTPPVIALSAYGLDGLVRLKWPKVTLAWGYRATAQQDGLYWDLRYLLLVPLAWNLWSLDQFDHTWLNTRRLGNDVAQVIEALRTPTAQWVATPFGEQYFVEPSVSGGLKLSPGVLNFKWKDRDPPQAFREASREGQPKGSIFEKKITDDINLYSRPEAQFAYIQTANSTVPCTAKAQGGYIDIYCRSEEDGSLFVAANRWPGWHAWIDGQPLDLVDSRWLVVRAPAGAHAYSFRYLPLDVGLGMCITVLGIGMTAVAWRRGYLASGPASGTDRKLTLANAGPG